MQFCLNYSSGKDSMLALDTLVNEGHQPVCLITSVNDEIDRSWFHGVPLNVLQAAADCLNLPLLTVPTNATTYEDAMVAALKQSQDYGATVAAFGDIDIEQNGDWDKQIAQRAGLTPILPLWQQGRVSLVHRFLDRGYTAMIKTVSKASGIPDDFLGQPLNQTFLDYLAAHDLDLCGENGEYHTLVVDGPLFDHPLTYKTAGIFDSPHARSLIIN